MKRGRESSPKGVCVKVKHLRPTYDDLCEWLACESHVLVTRKGRVFIKGEIFHYPGSEWANPFPVKEYGLEQSLELYEQHLTQLLRTPAVRERFSVLRDATEIGCFCEPGARCHRDVILTRLNEGL